MEKWSGDVAAVDRISLRIEDGEFFSLLRPSGCGKTTTLRLIAGFERPDAGAIMIDGADQVFIPPHKRPVNTRSGAQAEWNNLGRRRMCMRRRPRVASPTFWGSPT